MPSVPVFPNKTNGFYRLRFTVHLLIWVLVAAAYWGIRRSDWAAFEVADRLWMGAGFCLLPAIYYVLILKVIPWFHARGKALVFAICSLLVLVLLELNKQSIFAAANSVLGTDINFNYLTNQFLNGPIALGHFAALGHAMIMYLNDYTRYVQRLSAEKNVMELAFLRSQMDPHFLFNTLNTLYAMALEEGSDKTADAISRLGGLMRYSLHDSQDDLIPLDKEIDYINQYVELQKLRTTANNRITVNFKIDQESRQSKKIAPMMLIPLVENAFKYGVSPSEQTEIGIDLQVVGNELSLTVKNSIIKNVGKVEGQGVGLKNLQNRLKLLYGFRHRLQYGRRGDFFVARLMIELDAAKPLRRPGNRATTRH